MRQWGLAIWHAVLCNASDINLTIYRVWPIARTACFFSRGEYPVSLILYAYFVGPLVWLWRSRLAFMVQVSCMAKCSAPARRITRWTARVGGHALQVLVDWLSLLPLLAQAVLIGKELQAVSASLLSREVDKVRIESLFVDPCVQLSEIF